MSQKPTSNLFSLRLLATRIILFPISPIARSTQQRERTPLYKTAIWIQAWRFILIRKLARFVNIPCIENIYSKYIEKKIIDHAYAYARANFLFSVRGMERTSTTKHHKSRVSRKDKSSSISSMGRIPVSSEELITVSLITRFSCENCPPFDLYT